MIYNDQGIYSVLWFVVEREDDKIIWYREQCCIVMVCTRGGEREGERGRGR